MLLRIELQLNSLVVDCVLISLLTMEMKPGLIPSGL